MGNRRFKKISFWLGLILVLGTTLGQLVPLLDGQPVTLFPLGITILPGDTLERSYDPEVLGASEPMVPGFEGFGAGLTALTQGKTVGYSPTPSSRTQYLGPLAQGTMYRGPDPEVEGYGASYIYIYNVFEAGNPAVIRIKFRKIGGIPEIPQTLTLNKSIPATDGIMQPLHVLLNQACQASQVCQSNVGEIGAETPWAGFASVEHLSVSGKTMAAVEMVSTNKSYGFGHDAFLPQRNYGPSSYGDVGTSFNILDVGYGFRNPVTVEDHYKPLHSDIFVFSKSCTFSPASDDITLTLDTIDGSLSLGGPVSVDMDELGFNSCGGVFTVKEFLSEVLPPDDVPASWRGSLTIDLPAGDVGFTAANIINSEGIVGWGENGFEEGTYDRNSIYVGSVGENIYDVLHTSISVMNTSGVASAVRVKVYCTPQGGGAAGWQDMYVIDLIDPYSTAIISTEDLSNADHCYGQAEAWLGELRVDADAPNSRIVAVTRDYISTTSAGRGHRSYIPEGDPYTDVSQITFLPAAYARNDPDGMENFPASFLPQHPAEDNNMFWHAVSGYAAGNVNTNLSGSPFPGFFKHTFHTVLDGEIEGDLSGSCDNFDSYVPWNNENGVITYYPPCYEPELPNLEYFHPMYQGDILGMACVPDDPNAPRPCLATGEAVGGYVKSDGNWNGAGNLRLGYANIMGMAFWRNPWWEKTDGQDTYVSGEVTSLLPWEDYDDGNPGNDLRWLGNNYYSEFVFASDTEAYNVGTDPEASASDLGWNVMNYSFNQSENLYAYMWDRLEVLPSEGHNIDSMSDIVEPGVYLWQSEFAEETVDFEFIDDVPGIDDDPLILFVGNADDPEFILNVIPENVDEGLLVYDGVNDALEIAVDSDKTVLLVVEGNVKILPGENAIAEDGGDFLDSTIMATGKISVESDDIWAGNAFWQRDPLAVKGELFAAGGLLSNIHRDLGAAKNAIYPALKIEWNPAYLIELKDYFEQSDLEWGVPGVY